MNNTLKVISTGLGILALSACTAIDDDRITIPARYTFDLSPSYYAQNYRVTSYTYDNPKVVTVPESYYLGTTQAPIASKEADKTWVSGQNAQGYTIELADEEKASKVAQTLLKAPKNERMAQVKYQRDGKSYYKGLYGSYESPIAAQKALDALPSEIKKNAGVKSWGVVKGVIGE